MSDYDNFVTDQYGTKYFLKSTNTCNSLWINNHIEPGGFIQFMDLNYYEEMMINLHIGLNGQPTRKIRIPTFYNKNKKTKEYCITEEYLRQLIGNFVAQDKQLSVKKKIKKISKDFT